MKMDRVTEQQLLALPVIHEGDNFRLHLLQQNPFGRPVVIKSLQSHAGERSTVRLANEYHQTVNLQVQGIRQPRSQLLVNERPALALDFVEGTTVAECYVKQRQSLTENLEVAIAITIILEGLHRQSVIHRNLASAHILVSSPPLKVTLISFGNALIEKAERNISQADISSSMLAYISPEHTGRTNHQEDHRTDLYSLGVVLYEIFTGKLPFESKDMAGLIYAHLARNPPPPRDLNRELPKAIANLVMRLLAKNPDERYQSAYAIRYDLTAIHNQLQQTGHVGEISLGEADDSKVFQLPERLYDRTLELESLKQALANAANGCGNLVLISGGTGSGKSTLAEALRPIAVEQGANFITGAYESQQRHVPYAGLRQAFAEWINLALTSSIQQLTQWKRNLLETCGSNADLLLEMLPQLKLIIGPQPATPELAPTLAKNRLHHLFRNVLIASSQQQQPLILFLDNLQWADHATLQLLNQLHHGIDTLPIVILAAYRADEVGSAHPLTELNEALAQQKNSAQTLPLAPLSLESIHDLISDTLKHHHANILPVAELVLEKTGGNPLFIRQFLQALYDNHMLVFKAKERCWQWDLEAIRQQPIMGSVAGLMAEKIAKLPDATRSVLATAACIGTRFQSWMLSSLAETPEEKIIVQLHPAIETGLIQVTRTEAKSAQQMGHRFETKFAFAHERVRQAAYALQAQKKQRLNHLRIAKLLLNKIPEESIEDRVFEIADQFNEGFQFIEDPRERQQLVTINLMAGRKARRAAAYQAAIRYLSMGIGLLSPGRWKNPEEPTLELFIEAIEAEYLSANYERAALLSKEVLNHTDDLFSRLKVYELSTLFYTAQNNNLAAIEAGMSALNELGIDLTDRASEADRQQLVALSGRIEALTQIPAKSDSRHLACLRIMMHLAAPAERIKPSLLRTLIHKMVLMSANHGNSPMAAFAYGWYAAILCSTTHDIETGYRFGRLSLDILHQYPAAELETRVQLLFNAYVRHWKEPIQKSIDHLQQIFQHGIQTGDLEYTSLGAVHYGGYRLCTGERLEIVQRKQKEFLQTIEEWRLPFQGQLMRIWLQTIANLYGHGGDPAKLKGKFFDETEHFPQPNTESNNLFAFSLLCSHTMLHYLFGNYATAAESGKEAERYSQSILGLYYQVNHTFYYTLALLACHKTSDAADRAEYLNLAAPLIDRLRAWAALSPANFAHNLALVEAEQASALEQNGKAIEYFSLALCLARENNQLMNEALTWEREAVFYSALGRADIAGLSLRKAVDRYRSWGARYKAEVLEQRLKAQAQQEMALLDTTAVLKASLMLSQEVRLEQLLEKLMHIVIENAGAEKGLLIQKSDAGLLIQARGDGRGVATMQSTPIESSGEAALSVINYVARTQNQVVLNDARQDSTFGNDRYITEHRTRSLLCLPILYQRKLSGLLYLENNLASDVFTVDRLELLKVLASQAAISIENATLYRELENKINALRESELKFRAIFDHTFQFIGVMDTEGILRQANRTALQFIDANEEDVIGRPFWETPWWSHSIELQERLKNAIQQAKHGTLARFEATHTAPDGTLSYIDFSLKPVTDAEGHVIQLIPEGRDITERKQAEKELMRYKQHLEETVQQRTEELRLARDEAEAANRAKSVFLANMSHELRTPLNAILGFSHMMQRDETLSNEQHETLNIINNSGEHLLNLINDVLEIAKIEAGKLQLEIAPFDLHTMVNEVTDMMRLRAQQKGIQLELNQSDKTPQYIKSDEARLRQILVNLVSNAVKFTTVGNVTIRLDIKNNIQRLLIIDVADTGPGISAKDKQRLFNPFEQLREGKAQTGTGLGLSIVKHFIQLMGGNITVESSIGKGSLFHVEVPLVEADEIEIEALGEKTDGEVAGLSPGQPSYRILIAEDQQENQLLLSKMMQEIGMQVKVANNGKACVELFKKWKPDLIWMDRRMPVMDGMEATRQIRRIKGGDKVKIVAVTASAFKEQERELLEAGMDDQIHKPFLFREIYECLAQQLGVRFTYRTESKTPADEQKRLTPQLMLKVKAEQREALRVAIKSLDSESINAVINRIASVDLELGQTLSRLANMFDYPTILNVIEAIADKE
jgi:PAS domain S-box-containing protein